MSSANIKIARLCIKIIKYLSVFIIAFGLDISIAWDVDLSHRTEFSKKQDRDLLQESKSKENDRLGFLSKSLDVSEPTQDIAILNTENGFVPDKIVIRKNGSYKIHVVNVNAQQKNVSFVMSDFSQHHGTYFGEKKDFVITPKVEGIFPFQCPETSIQGKIIVLPNSERKLTAE